MRTLVASHADITDEGQTITFGKPAIGTTATIDGEKTAVPAEQITITDTVEYSGLTVGQEYKLTGVLMDKETGEPLLIGEGEEQTQVTSEATFTPAEPNGTIDVLFTFDGSALLGKSVVVFETLYQGEDEVTAHTDIEDEGQTVTFVEGPVIGTTATVDGQHTAVPSREVTIVDEVAYSGLTPGETYKVSGVLVDKATGEPLLVGEEQTQVTAEVEFTPEEASGTVELTYTLDASAPWREPPSWCFETLYSDGEVEVASHTRTSRTKTRLWNSRNRKSPPHGHHRHRGWAAHRRSPPGRVAIVDVVAYTGLTPWRDLYQVSGVLMDKATGAASAGGRCGRHQVTAEVEFTPEAADGTVELDLHAGRQRPGGYLRCGVRDALSLAVWRVAAHADIEDEAQTVDFRPSRRSRTLGTTATVDGQHTAEPAG